MVAPVKVILYQDKHGQFIHHEETSTVTDKSNPAISHERQLTAFELCLLNVIDVMSKNQIRRNEGEPYFVLLGRDPQAPVLLRQWAMERMACEPDSWKPADVMEIIKAMRAYKEAHPEIGLSMERYQQIASLELPAGTYALDIDDEAVAELDMCKSIGLQTYIPAEGEPAAADVMAFYTPDPEHSAAVQEWLVKDKDEIIDWSLVKAAVEKIGNLNHHQLMVVGMMNGRFTKWSSLYVEIDATGKDENSVEAWMEKNKHLFFILKLSDNTHIPNLLRTSNVPGKLTAHLVSSSPDKLGYAEMVDSYPHAVVATDFVRSKENRNMLTCILRTPCSNPRITNIVKGPAPTVDRLGTWDTSGGAKNSFDDFFMPWPFTAINNHRTGVTRDSLVVQPMSPVPPLDQFLKSARFSFAEPGDAVDSFNVSVEGAGSYTFEKTEEVPTAEAALKIIADGCSNDDVRNGLTVEIKVVWNVAPPEATILTLGAQDLVSRDAFTVSTPSSIADAVSVLKLLTSDDFASKLFKDTYTVKVTPSLDTAGNLQGITRGYSWPVDITIANSTELADHARIRGLAQPVWKIDDAWLSVSSKVDEIIKETQQTKVTVYGTGNSGRKYTIVANAATNFTAIDDWLVANVGKLVRFDVTDVISHPMDAKELIGVIGVLSTCDSIIEACVIDVMRNINAFGHHDTFIFSDSRMSDKAFIRGLLSPEQKLESDTDLVRSVTPGLVDLPAGFKVTGKLSTDALETIRKNFPKEVYPDGLLIGNLSNETIQSSEPVHTKVSTTIKEPLLIPLQIWGISKVSGVFSFDVKVEIPCGLEDVDSWFLQHYKELGPDGITTFEYEVTSEEAVNNINDLVMVPGSLFAVSNHDFDIDGYAEVFISLVKSKATSILPVVKFNVWMQLETCTQPKEAVRLVRPNEKKDDDNSAPMHHPV